MNSFVQNIPSSPQQGKKNQTALYQAKNKSHMQPGQQATLNEFFFHTQGPSRNERIELGLKVGLTPRQVQIWFQNKRQKLKLNSSPLKQNQYICFSVTEMKIGTWDQWGKADGQSFYYADLVSNMLKWEMRDEDVLFKIEITFAQISYIIYEKSAQGTGQLIILTSSVPCFSFNKNGTGFIENPIFLSRIDQPNKFVLSGDDEQLYNQFLRLLQASPMISYIARYSLMSPGEQPIMSSFPLSDTRSPHSDMLKSSEYKSSLAISSPESPMNLHSGLSSQGYSSTPSSFNAQGLTQLNLGDFSPNYPNLKSNSFLNLGMKSNLPISPKLFDGLMQFNKVKKEGGIGFEPFQFDSLFDYN